MNTLKLTLSAIVVMVMVGCNDAQWKQYREALAAADAKIVQIEESIDAIDALVIAETQRLQAQVDAGLLDASQIAPLIETIVTEAARAREVKETALQQTRQALADLQQIARDAPTPLEGVGQSVSYGSGQVGAFLPEPYRTAVVGIGGLIGSIVTAIGVQRRTRRSTADSVVRPIERSRDRELEARLKTEGRSVIVLDRATVSAAHEAAGVTNLIASATK